MVKLGNFLLCLLLLFSTTLYAETPDEDGEYLYYLRLGTPFLVNLQSPQSKPTYLQTRIRLGVTDIAYNAITEENQPLFRHNILMILAEQSPNNIIDPASLQAVREYIQEVSNQLFAKLLPKDEDGKPQKEIVKKVLFTDLLVEKLY